MEKQNKESIINVITKVIILRLIIVIIVEIRKIVIVIVLAIHVNVNVITVILVLTPPVSFKFRSVFIHFSMQENDK